MAIRNARREELLRLESKTLDGQFLGLIQQGLGCSPFEANAVLQVVHEVYFPFLSRAGSSAPPGKITLLAVGADEPAGKSIRDCLKVPVCLTVHRGAEDDWRLQSEGPIRFRQQRIPELCQEALSQGALLTREDLAYRVFFVGARTISRDLACLRRMQPPPVVPLRSTVQDIGPLLTHRVEIVRLALQGKTTTEICRILRHSPAAVANYVCTFTRCAQLAERKMGPSQMAFLLRRGPALIRQYLALLAECQRDPNLAYHLQQLLQIGQAGLEKKRQPRRPAHA